VDPIGVEPTASAGAGGDGAWRSQSAAMVMAVDPIGVEPTASAMPWRRSTN
jgi:hypothetical protein